MKVTIILLAAIVCFSAGNPSISEQPEPIDLLVEEDYANGIDEFETHNIFIGFWWYLRGALHNIKRINCTITEVINIKTATQNFIDNIYDCGADAVEAFKNVITAANSVITTCNNIMNYKENVCKNSNKCFFKLLRQVIRLDNQIKNTLNAIKKVPTIPGEAAVCSKNASNELTNILNSFSTNIRNCSKLKN